MRYFFEAEEKLNKVSSQELKQNIRTFAGDKDSLRLLTNNKFVTQELRNIFISIMKGEALRKSDYRRLAQVLKRKPEVAVNLINLFSDPEDQVTVEELENL